MDENNWADVRVVYYVSDFNITAPVEVSLYINDQLISSFQTTKGFTQNFIQLEAYTAESSNNYHSLFDNFVVKSSAQYIYDASSTLFDMSKDWTLNGTDKQGVTFLSPREESSVATHTGAITIDGETYIEVADNLVLQQIGAFGGSGKIVKDGNGVLKINTEECAMPDPVDSMSFVVNSGELDYKGVFKGDLEIQRDAVFSPGNSVGTAVIEGEFKADALATLLFEQDASGMDSLTASSFVLDDNTVIDLDLTAIVPGATYDIFINSSADGFTEEQGKDSYWLGKFSEDLPDYYDFSIVGNHIVRLHIDANKVPEPSTWALLALGVCGLLYLRKRG